MSSSHRDLCKISARWLLENRWCDLSCWELKMGRGFVDAIGIGSSARFLSPQIAVVEVKASRSDLLGDLRRRKMIKYEVFSTRCYIAAPIEVFQTKTIRTKAQIIQDLQEKGLPDTWGILIIKPRYEAIQELRPPRLLRTLRRGTTVDLTRKIARSLCYRALGGTL